MYAVGGTHRISKEGLGPIHQLTEEGREGISPPTSLHRLPFPSPLNRCFAIRYAFDVDRRLIRGNLCPFASSLPSKCLASLSVISISLCLRSGQKNGSRLRIERKKKRRGTSFLGQIGIGRCGRKEGRKEGRNGGRGCHRWVPNRISGELSIPGVFPP